VSRARYTDFAPAGDHIPGAIARAAAVGVTVPDLRRFFGSLRWRYFGPRPLIEDASVRSHSTSLFYHDLGYDLARDLRLTCQVFNLFDVKASDLDYYYTSRLPGEPTAGVAGVHFHPAESRSVRLVAAYRFDEAHSLRSNPRSSLLAQRRDRIGARGGGRRDRAGEQGNHQEAARDERVGDGIGRAHAVEQAGGDVTEGERPDRPGD
jgi:hypothetical protein